VNFAHRTSLSPTRWMSLILARLGTFRSVGMGMIGLADRTRVAVGAPLPCRPRILVVDDCAVNQLAVSALLWRWGIRPLIAGDGAEALALACAHDFDLILMDLQMPILDGLTATKQLRRFEMENARPRTPVVAYTSSHIDGNETMLKAWGIDATLEKPCSAESLERCLAQWWRSDLAALRLHGANSLGTSSRK
jgi:CheY-like chemotaxis protein